jgi:hypothetical protein
MSARLFETSKESGPALKPNLIVLRDLRNGVAKEMKYPDYFALQVTAYGMTTDEMLKMLDDWRATLRPLYFQLHLAKLFVNVPDTRIWLTSPAPAGFLRWEGPIVLPTDPMIRVDLLSGEKSGPAESAGTIRSVNKMTPGPYVTPKSPQNSAEI